MIEELVELSEDEHAFHIDGNSSASFLKLGRSVLMQHPIKGAIPKDKVRGLFIDETASPPGLYLDWSRGNLQEHTYLGEINDLNFARDFISRVNTLYKQNAS